VRRPMRVLMVEDVATEAQLSARMLKQSGLFVTHEVVDSEPEFRQAIERFRPHVILSDFTLPAFDGLTALAIANHDAPNTPFIFLSGTIGEERAIDVLKRGAVDYVLKTNPARLPNAVKRAVREAGERRRRRRAEKHIRESEQRLRDIVDTATDWIWDLAADGRYLFSSRSVQGILGFDVSDLINQPFSDFIHPEDREGYARTLSSMSPLRRDMRGCIARWKHINGDYRWLEGNFTAHFDPNGGPPLGFRGTHRDFTERMQQQERIVRLTRVLQMQSGINAAVVRIRNRDELLREACRLATEVAGYDHAALSLTESSGKRARPWYQIGTGSDLPLPPAYEIGDGTEPDTSMTGRALRTGEIVVCNDLTKSEPPVAMRSRMIAMGFTSVVAVPLTMDGARIGALTLASRESATVHEEELLLLQDIAASLSLALQYLQKEDTVQFLAYFDALTGLAKRSLFCERLDRTLKNRAGLEGTPTIVAFDVQHLSNVNDSFGHHVGDLLLQRVADRLRHHIQDDERLGHLGGGTFVMLASALSPAEDGVSGLLGSAAFNDVFSIEGRNIRISFKSGIAQALEVGEDGNTLVQKAEAALKDAKDSGEQFLQYQVRSDVAERLALEHKLRIALDEEQFVLYYQPKINISDGRIESVEALIRWRDPERGITPPGLFLPLLESSGMIVPVGEWVLRQAAQDCARWRSLGLGPMRVAVNVSALQLRRRNFVDQVLSTLGDWAVDGYGIDLEITETGFLQDLEGTSRKLRELREAGVRIALDDFGTGYSALGLLSKLPVDTLKIDRTFISGLPDDRASTTLVSSIIGLAAAFNLTVVAEGVETQAQYEVLRTLKCHQSQGFLHCRPVPVEQLEELLRVRPTAPPRDS